MISIKNIEKKTSEEVTNMRFNVYCQLEIKTDDNSLALDIEKAVYIDNGLRWIMLLTEQGSFGLYFDDADDLATWWQAMKLLLDAERGIECSSLAYTK